MCHKELFHWAITKKSIKSKSPGKSQKSIKSKIARQRHFLRKTKCLIGTIFSLRQNFALDKNPKMENFLKTKKRLTSDFPLGNTGGWGGGVSNTRSMIGNFRVNK